MPQKLGKSSSNAAPKSGAKSNLANKINSSKTNSNINFSQRTQTNDSTNSDTNKSKQFTQEDLNKYNSKLQDYENSSNLAFMKEENFNNQNSDAVNISGLSISELNEYMASSNSLASRITTATGRFNSDTGGFGSGRSRLPGGGSRGGGLDNNTSSYKYLPRNALTNSLLYRNGISSDQAQANNPLAGTTYVRSSGSQSAVNNKLNGVPNTTINFEGFARSYLKDNSNYLYDKFNNDPNFRENYLNKVETLYNKIDVRTLGQAPVEESTSRLQVQAGLANSRDKQLVANAMMTLLANNNTMFNKIANSGLKVFLADSIVSQGENVAGYFSTQNHMVLARNPGFVSFNATAVHELMHAIDHTDGNLDGHIQGMSNNWSNLRTNAFDRIDATNGYMNGLDQGFVNYSTTNNMEFVAVMTQLYQTDSKDLKINFPEIFSTLDRMFRVV